MKILIVGLGLIGGSFAKALKERTEHTVLGFDRSVDTITAALEQGAIDGTGGAADADIVILALYPRDSVEFIRRNTDSFKRGAIVIDLCGIKRFVCREAEALLKGGDVIFIGGHPMAGRELSGFGNSLSGLFDGASMILTPDTGTPPEKLEAVKSLCLEIGFGGITISTPEHHDEMIAFTSQLAHIVSSAYVQNPICDGYMGFSAGSFGDMTRVAKLNEDMWTELFLLNRDNLTTQIGVLISNLEKFRRLIGSTDERGLRDMLKRGRKIKEKLNRQ